MFCDQNKWIKYWAAAGFNRLWSPAKLQMMGIIRFAMMWPHKSLQFVAGFPAANVKNCHQTLRGYLQALLLHLSSRSPVLREATACQTEEDEHGKASHSASATQIAPPRPSLGEKLLRWCEGCSKSTKNGTRMYLHFGYKNIKNDQSWSTNC